MPIPINLIIEDESMGGWGVTEGGSRNKIGQEGRRPEYQTQEC